MMTKGHLICSTALAAVLLILGIEPLYILLVIWASLAIDIDHALNYIFIFKRYNIIEILNYFKRKVVLKNSTAPLPVFIFHNYETLLILAVLSWFFPFVTYILAGIIFHMVLDWCVLPAHRYPPVIKLSLILVLIENRRRRKGYYKW